QVGIEREEGCCICNLIAFPHGKRFHATRFIGAYEYEIGLDPTLKLGGPGVRAQIEEQSDTESDDGNGPSESQRARPCGGHDEPFRALPVSTSRCARRRAPTSRGSISAKRASQMTATSSGATISWG